MKTVRSPMPILSSSIRSSRKSRSCATPIPDLKLGKISSYQDGILGQRMTSGDGHCTLIQVSLDTPLPGDRHADHRRSHRARIRAKMGDTLKEQANKALKLYATGSAGIGRDLTRSCGDSLESTTLATVILVIVVLLLVYRAPLLALIPLADHCHFRVGRPEDCWP